MHEFGFCALLRTDAQKNAIAPIHYKKARNLMEFHDLGYAYSCGLFGENNAIVYLPQTKKMREFPLIKQCKGMSRNA